MGAHGEIGRGGKLPGLNEMRDALGLDFRRLNSSKDLLSKDRVCEVVSAFGDGAAKVDVDFDFSALYRGHEGLRANDINLRRTPDIVNEIQKEGVRTAFHATNLLAWNVFLGAGNWITSGSAPDLGFWSVTKLVDEYASGEMMRLSDYFSSGHDTRALISRFGVKLTPDEIGLSETGVLIGVDINGYSAFKNSGEWGALDRFSPHTLWSVCPPPPSFLKPLAVVSDSSFDLRRHGLPNIDW